MIPFDVQLEAVLQVIHDDEDRRAFLAGVRFAQGFVEFGDSVWRKSQLELLREADEEAADQMVYRKVAQALAQAASPIHAATAEQDGDLL